MKFLASTLAISLASVACTGDISGVGDPADDGPGNPAQPNGPKKPGDKTPPITDPPKVDVGECSATTLARPRVWRLTTAQIKNTLVDTVGFSGPMIDSLPGESRVEGYANRADKLPIAPLLADYYYKASEEIAADVARRSADFIGCPLANLGGDCLKDFITKFGQRMWRRPLTSMEVTRFTTFFTKTSAEVGGAEAGFKGVVQAMFLSPNFLYRTELGGSQQGVTALTDHELASALSYTLWDSPPDATLLEAANQQKLHTKDELVAQAQRLLGSPQKAPKAMHHFLQQWLKIESLPAQSKDPMMFSFYSPQVAADLMEENRLFFNSVMFEDKDGKKGDRTFRSLFTASHGYVNARTAPVYGMDNMTRPALEKTSLDPSKRRGLLTLGSFLAAHADPDGTALVDRGRYVREEILCSPVPDPNAEDAKFDPKFATEDMTGREKFAVHSTNPVCAACHKAFDGMGFALESYDAVGRWREKDKGKTLDPSGTVPLPSGTGDLAFKDFIDLIDKLSNTPDLYNCFSQQYMTYAMGSRVEDVHSCELKLVSDEFTKSGYKMDALVMAVIKSPSFSARKN